MGVEFDPQNSSKNPVAPDTRDDFDPAFRNSQERILKAEAGWNINTPYSSDKYTFEEKAKKESQENFVRFIARQAEAIAELDVKLDQLSEDYKNALARREQLFEELQQIHERIHQKKTERDEIDSEIKTEQNKLDETQDKLNVYKTHRDNQNKLNDKKNDLANAKESGADKKTIKKIETEVHECECKCNESQEQIDKIPEKEKTLEERITDSENKLENLNKKRAAKNTELQEELAKEKECSESLEQAEQEVEKIKEERRIIEEEKEKIKEQGIEGNEEKYKVFSEKSDALKIELEAREKEYQEKREARKNHNHEEEIQKLREELNLVDNEIKQEQTLLASITEQFNNIAKALPPNTTELTKTVGTVASAVTGSTAPIALAETVINLASTTTGETKTNTDQSTEQTTPQPKFNQNEAELEAKILAQIENGIIAKANLDDIKSPELRKKMEDKLAGWNVKINDPDAKIAEIKPAKPEIFGGEGVKHQIAELGNTPAAEHVKICGCSHKSKPSEFSNAFGKAAEPPTIKPEDPALTPTGPKVGAQFSLGA